MVLCDVYDEESDELVPYAPRGILRRQLVRAAESGYVAMGASELELYVFKDSYDDIARKSFVNLEPIGRVIEDYHILQGTKEEFLIGAIRRHLERSGVPVESSKGEWGPGQQEIGLRYAGLLEMADRHAIYKHAAKEIAWQTGHAITFMAKWDERHAGSSCHIHASLWTPDGKPLFPGEETLGSIRCSPLFRWFLGGWMAHIRELFAFYAPYPSSYKRYVPARPASASSATAPPCGSSAARRARTRIPISLSRPPSRPGCTALPRRRSRRRRSRGTCTARSSFPKSLTR
jgi:glutamine synthetase